MGITRHGLGKGMPNKVLKLTQGREAALRGSLFDGAQLNFNVMFTNKIN